MPEAISKVKLVLMSGLHFYTPTKFRQRNGRI